MEPIKYCDFHLAKALLKSPTDDFLLYKHNICNTLKIPGLFFYLVIIN